MRKTHKDMCQNDEVVTRRIIYIDENNEYVEMRDNTRKFLYQQWDKNRGITYVPKNKNKRKGSK